MESPYDLVVLGAGMAGVAAATKCAAAGWRVAIVDPLPYGGTCALRGCDPKKILRRGAEVVEAARLMRGKGIDTTDLRINWTDLMRHKHGFTDAIPDSVESGLADHDVTTLHGSARFTGRNEVTVGATTYTSERFLIATGARPRPLTFPGHEHVIDSTHFLDLAAPAARVLFVGGGFISFEFAHLVARAGSHATVIDRGAHPLKTFDPDLVDLLVDRGTDVGITVRRRTSVVDIRPNGEAFDVTMESEGRQDVVQVDLVVHGAGREPDLEGLDLATAGVAHTGGGVSVHPHLQSTSNPAVWAAGDCADTPGAPLTPVAVFQAKVAASNMLRGSTTEPDYAGVPTSVFTIPELARVGLLESEARERGIDLRVAFHDTSGWYSNYRVGETTAAAKVLIDQATDRVVGAHLLGPDYAELVNTLALAVKLGLTTRQLKSATAAYPSVGSDLGSML